MDIKENIDKVEAVARYLFNIEYAKVAWNEPQDDAWLNCPVSSRKFWYIPAREILSLLSPVSPELTMLSDEDYK